MNTFNNAQSQYSFFISDFIVYKNSLVYSDLS